MPKPNKDNKCSKCAENKVNGGSCKGMPPNLPSCGGYLEKK